MVVVVIVVGESIVVVGFVIGVAVVVEVEKCIR